jgi:hypothetical protein
MSFQPQRVTVVVKRGVSAAWLFGNVFYATWRSQDSHPLLRKVAFVLGLPLSMLSFLLVSKGGGDVFGIQTTKKY